MCYSQGALGRFNPVGRVLGKSYKAVDPLMAASERDLDKRLTTYFDSNTEVRKGEAETAARDARIETNMANMYAQQNPQRKTLLTGASLAAPATAAAPGLSLLGG